MDDERILKVLEEIRDQQRQQIENYKQAVEIQRQAIEVTRQWQQKTGERQFWLILAVLAFIVVLWAVAMANR